jgi:DUF2934 family protein
MSSKPVPPKDQPRQTGSRPSSAGTAAPSRAGANSAPASPAPARQSAPPVSRPRVIEPTAPSHEQIAQRAYQIWQDQGCCHGRDCDHWFEAERQLHQQANGPRR